LHYEAFPWFESIQKFSRENGHENAPLEPTKNGTDEGNVGAENNEKSKWYYLAHQVRISILEY
jgi:hypothetical protein